MVTTPSYLSSSAQLPCGNASAQDYYVIIVHAIWIQWRLLLWRTYILKALKSSLSVYVESLFSRSCVSLVFLLGFGHRFCWLANCMPLVGNL